MEAIYTLDIHTPQYNYHYRRKAIYDCKQIHSGEYFQLPQMYLLSNRFRIQITTATVEVELMNLEIIHTKA